MSKIFSQVIGFVIAVLLAVQLPIANAVNETSNDSFLDNENTLSSDWLEMMEILNDLDHYQVRIRVTNLDQAEKVFEGKILNNETTGNRHFIFNYAPTESVPNGVHYDLVTYRDFELAYSNTISVLDQIRYFNQEHFPVSLGQKIESYINYYMAVEVPKGLGQSMPQPFLQSLILMPTIEQINNLSTGTYTHINNQHQLLLQRTEIPRNWFNTSNHLFLNQEFSMNISNDRETQNVFDVDPVNRLSASFNNSQFNLSTHYTSTAATSLLPNPLLPASRDYEVHQEVSSSAIINRLTKVFISFNPERPRLTVRLVGLRDNYQLNFFNQDSADYATEAYLWEFTVMPTEESIPAMDNLERITPAEFVYLLKQMFTLERIGE